MRVFGFQFSVFGKNFVNSFSCILGRLTVIQ